MYIKLLRDVSHTMSLKKYFLYFLVIVAKEKKTKKRRDYFRIMN